MSNIKKFIFVAINLISSISYSQKLEIHHNQNGSFFYEEIVNSNHVGYPGVKEFRTLTNPSVHFIFDFGEKIDRKSNYSSFMKDISYLGFFAIEDMSEGSKWTQPSLYRAGGGVRFKSYLSNLSIYFDLILGVSYQEISERIKIAPDSRGSFYAEDFLSKLPDSKKTDVADRRSIDRSSKIQSFIKTIERYKLPEELVRESLKEVGAIDEIRRADETIRAQKENYVVNKKSLAFMSIPSIKFNITTIETSKIDLDLSFGLSASCRKYWTTKGSCDLWSSIGIGAEF